VLTTFQLCLAILALLATTSAAARQSASAAGTPSAPAAGVAGQSAQTDPSYVIGAQDVLDISVWKDQELTRTVPVRPDGKISLPLLNDIQAAGLTPNDLKNQITESLKKFMTDPIVTVIVSQINSQRVYVTGEVAHAGAMPLLPQMTILQALSSSGGFTQFANVKKIYMFRMVNGKQVNFPFNYKDVIHGKNTNENVVLKPGDTIVVP
jgi:polysaccharide export outer membrane protein